MASKYKMKKLLQIRSERSVGMQDGGERIGHQRQGYFLDEDGWGNEVRGM